MVDAHASPSKGPSVSTELQRVSFTKLAMFAKIASLPPDAKQVEPSGLLLVGLMHSVFGSPPLPRVCARRSYPPLKRG